ncbi:hypothetical protein niasHS_016887 [Heterodera schachtii]|uniref:Uncharacterized protein n=1 Tax=Heterodera schachtii TaxID=97005 RepID=A0ABD2HYY1_HETSC
MAYLQRFDYSVADLVQAACSPEGLYPLMLAVQTNHDSIVHFLLKHGADLTKRDPMGNNAHEDAHATTNIQARNTHMHAHIHARNTHTRTTITQTHTHTCARYTDAQYKHSQIHVNMRTQKHTKSRTQTCAR